MMTDRELRVAAVLMRECWRAEVEWPPFEGPRTVKQLAEAVFAPMGYADDEIDTIIANSQ